MVFIVITLLMQLTLPLQLTPAIPSMSALAGPINFEDADLSSLPPPVQQNSQDKEVPILERPSKTAGNSLVNNQ